MNHAPMMVNGHTNLGQNVLCIASYLGPGGSMARKPRQRYIKLARRGIRKIETRQWRDEVADELADELVFHEVETITFEPVDFNALYEPEFEPEHCGCYCRRCVLHDDHGGCLTPEFHMSPTGAYHAHIDGGFYG